MTFTQIFHFYFNYATIFRKKSSACLKIQTGGACNASVTGTGYHRKTGDQRESQPTASAPPPIGTALCCRITQSTLRSTISDTATFNLTPSITTEGRYTPYSNSAPDTYCMIVSVLRSDDPSTGNDAGASWYLS